MQNRFRQSERTSLQTPWNLLCLTYVVGVALMAINYGSNWNLPQIMSMFIVCVLALMCILVIGWSQTKSDQGRTILVLLLVTGLYYAVNFLLLYWIGPGTMLIGAAVMVSLFWLKIQQSSFQKDI